MNAEVAHELFLKGKDAVRHRGAWWSACIFSSAVEPIDLQTSVMPGLVTFLAKQHCHCPFDSNHFMTRG